jgi:hypothetical protein
VWGPAGAAWGIGGTLEESVIRHLSDKASNPRTMAAPLSAKSESPGLPKIEPEQSGAGLFPSANLRYIESTRKPAPRGKTSMDSNFRPRPVEGIETNEIADGYVVYDPKQDRVHYLNQTAAVILELCNGRMTTGELVSVIQDAYSLIEPPVEEVADCVQRLIEEGLIN